MPRASRLHLTAIALLLAAAPQFGLAQTVEDLDHLIEASSKPKEGVALAQLQTGNGVLLEALTTLERVLASDPKHKEARLLRASLLCRLDDLPGAGVEFSRLKKGDYKKGEWAAAQAPCAARVEPAQ